MAKTASDYIAEATANAGAKKTAPKVAASSAPVVQFTAGKAAKPQSPANWLIDILSRPLSGVTNAIQGSVNGVVDAQKAAQRGDTAGSIGATLSAGNIPGNFLSGFLSADPAQHRTFSQVLEQSTDKIGSLDPKYVNRQDNVDPVLKGTLGFVGDVALDPLTWIPGAQVLKGINLGVKGAKIGLEAAGAASKAVAEVARTAKAGTKAAETAAKDATKIEVPSVSTALQADAEKAAQVSTDQAAVKQAEAAATPPPTTTEELLAQSRQNVDAALSTAKAKAMKSTLKGFDPLGIKIKPENAEIMAKVAKDSRVAKSLPFEEWAVHAEDSVLDLPVAKQPKVFVAGKNIPMIEAIGQLQRNDPAARVGLAAWHADNYFPAFNAGVKAGHKVDALGAPIKEEAVRQAGVHAELQDNLATAQQHLDQLSSDPQYAESVLADALRSHAAAPAQITGEAAPTLDGLLKDATDEVTNAQLHLDTALGKETSASQVIYSARQQFLKQHKEKLGDLTTKLGPKLVTNLYRNTKSDARFDSVLSELKGILDRQIDPHVVEQLTPASERMLNELGVTTPLPKDIQLAQELPNVTPPPAKLNDVLGRAAQEGLDPKIIESAKPGIEKVLAEIKTAKAWKAETATGVKRSHDVEGVGVGSIPNEFNQFKQMSVLQPIMKYWSEDAAKLAEAGSKSGFGRDRARYVRDNFMPALRLAERVLDEHGVPLVFGINKGERIPLSASQTLDILNEINPKGMEAYFFNGNTSVPPTNLFDAIYAAATGGSPQDVEALLRQTKTAWSKTEFKSNNLVNPVTKVGKGGTKYQLGREVFTGEQLVSGLRDTIMAATPTLHKAMEANAAALRARGLAEAGQATDEALGVLEAAFSNGTVADLFTGITDTSKRIAENGAQMGMTDLGKSLATATSEGMIPPVDRVVAKGTVRADEIATKGGKLREAEIKAAAKGGKGKSATAVIEDIQRDGVDNQLSTFDNVVDETLRQEGGQVRDLGGANQAAFQAGWFRKQFAKVNREFQMRDIHDKVVGNENLWRDMVGKVSGQLNDLSRVLTRDQMGEAFRSLQKGFQPNDPLILQHLPQIQDIVEQMFGRADSASLIDASFFRNNASLDHINIAMRRYTKGEFQFNADLAAKEATAAGSSHIMKYAADQWKSWDVKDPAEFLNGMYTAMTKINLDMSTAQSWAKLVKDMDKSIPGSIMSKTPKPGFSRIGNDSGKSIFAKYLPDSTYYRDDILDQLHMADILTQQSLDLSGDFGRFINTVYKPIQDLWKTGMTVVNPTHHIRNMVSDASLTYLAEGWTSKDIYKRALHVIGARNSYSNWDAIKAIQGMNEIPNAGRVIISKSSLFPDGITADGLYSALAQRGNLPQFRTLESLDDLTGESVSGLQKAQQKLIHSKQMRFVGGISEARDHYARIAHAIQILESPKYAKQFKTANEFLDFASARVRKWHPDGSDLTSTEQGFKLIIPFYSWQRKTIPLIAESLLTHPARVTVFPKASYALATTMGVNPDSLADPFPQDQMFPTYLTDQIDGPQFNVGGKYYGINPGFAGNDIINTYLGANPIQATLGSVSPFLRAPFELAAGAQVGTGAKINDTSDYVDSQLPGIAPISRITGDSVTGSLLSLLQGKGLDQQYQIQKGNKDQGTNAAISATNWLLGAGLTPMSQPNQINYAEIEARNRAGAAANGK